MNEVGDIIINLLNRPFSQRSEEDKRFILNKGRPTPNLSCVQMSNTSNRWFKTIWYEKYKWLCGSYNLNCLFCWPCLIVSVRRNVWSKEGFRDWKNLARALERHSSSKDHIQNGISVKQFSRKATNFLDQLSEYSNRLKNDYNKNVSKNRKVFSMLIDLVCLLCKQELPFQGLDESNCSLNQGNFKEIFNVMMKYNEDLKCHWEKMGAFTGLLKTVQNDIVECIAEEMKDAINNMIKEAHFFSIQVDEMTEKSEIPQYSVTCRCVNSRGQIKEHFLGFYDFGENKNTEGICQQLIKILQPFDFENKLIAQTYDGASVKSSELNELQANIRTYAPQALFIHSLDHCLNLVLQRSCENLPHVKALFTTLQGISDFFHESSIRTYVLNKIVGKKILTHNETLLNSNAKIVAEIFNERVKIIQVFEELMNINDMSGKTLWQAEAYRNKLSEFDFVFYLLVFHEIFSKAEPLCNALQEKAIDIQKCVSEISICETDIQSMRNDETFQYYMDKTQTEMELSPHSIKYCESIDDALVCNYKRNFFEIIDNILFQIRTRFSNISSLKFLELSNSTHFESFSKRFPDDALNLLIGNYGKYFEEHLLKNELMIIYADENRHLFYDADIETILKNIIEIDLCDTLPQSYKLFSLVATIPATPLSTERNFSCLNRIKSWLRSSMGNEQLSSLSLPFIEKELLLNLSLQDKWYENIIKRFASQKEGEIDLIFK